MYLLLQKHNTFCMTRIFKLKRSQYEKHGSKKQDSLYQHSLLQLKHTVLGSVTFLNIKGKKDLKKVSEN